MSEFNPSDPKYKKVEDLPKEEQGNYGNFKDGFVEKEAIDNQYSKYEGDSVEKRAEWANRVDDHLKNAIDSRFAKNFKREEDSEMMEDFFHGINFSKEIIEKAKVVKPGHVEFDHYLRGSLISPDVPGKSGSGMHSELEKMAPQDIGGIESSGGHVTACELDKFRENSYSERDIKWVLENDREDYSNLLTGAEIVPNTIIICYHDRYHTSSKTFGRHLDWAYVCEAA